MREKPMEVVWPLAVAGAFALFAHTAERSIREIPVSRPMPRSLQVFAAGCTAVVVGLLLDGLQPPRPWRYSLMFCLFVAGIMVSEYAWVRRYRCDRQGAGKVPR
jgi:peptidoglycan/LPS O-acetylase OafA/YrhL